LARADLVICRKLMPIPRRHSASFNGNLNIRSKMGCFTPGAGKKSLRKHDGYKNG
jgi:hypothetical protein